MRINKSLIAYTPTSGAGSGSVTSVALTAPTGFTVSGSPITTSGTLALSFTTGYGIPPLMTGNSGKFLTTNGTTMSWVNIAGTDVTGAALTEVDDTNVTMTLGGTPSTALLRSVSMTLGWSGQLAVGRGGTGAGTLTGVVIGNATSAFTAVAGTAGQFLRRNTANTAYEFRTLQGGDIAGSELTFSNDTNVTMSLSGTPASALLQPVTIGLGWTGTLSVSRGGIGVGTITGVMIGNGTSAVTGVTGTANQILRRNSGNTAYEFWSANYLVNPMTLEGSLIYATTGGTPAELFANSTSTRKYLSQINGTAPTWEALSFLTGSGTTNYVAKWTPSGAVLGNSQIIDDGTNVGIGVSPSYKLDVNGVIGLAGTAFAEKFGNYNVIYEPDGNKAIWAGNNSDQSNYYDNNTHYFRPRGGGSTWVTLDSTGLGIGVAATNKLSVNGNVNITGSILSGIWSGSVISVPYGGTGATTLTGVVIGNSTGAMTAVAGTSEQLLRRNTANTGYEFWTPTYLGNPFTAANQIIYSNSANAPLTLNPNGTANNLFLRSVSSGSPSWAAVTGADITGAALTKVDDTNVTMTLGGTPATSLLRAASMTLGWSGQLSVSRGGTGASTLTGVVIGNSTGTMTAVAGTADQLLRRNSANTAYEFYTPTFLSNPMIALGDMIVGNAAGAPLRLVGNINTQRRYLSQIGDGTNVTSTSWQSISGADITGAALTSNNDTNVTVTLGGTPATSLLRAASITMGWSGTLAVGRGGSGASTLTGVLVGNGSSAFTGVTGTASQLLRRNTSNTAFEFWTPDFPTGSGTTNFVTKWTGGSTIGNSIIQDDGINVGIGFAGSWKLDVNGAIGLSGSKFAEKFGNYNVIYEPDGNRSIWMGNNSDQSNLYDNNNHYFRVRGGSSINATINSSGLQINTGHLQLPSANYITWGGAYGANIPTISGTSGTGAFLQFYPSGSSSGVKMALRDTGQLALPGYTTSTSFTGTATASLAVTSAGDVITIAPVQTTASGTYTPTYTGLANVDSTTAYTCQYSRVGDTVTVSGYVMINATADNTPTRLSITLPVSSTTSSVNYANGTIAQVGGGAAGSIIGYGANTAEIGFSVLANTGDVYYSFIFAYRII